jgi:hypothetical protein
VLPDSHPDNDPYSEHQSHTLPDCATDAQQNADADGYVHARCHGHSYPAPDAHALGYSATDSYPLGYSTTDSFTTDS